MGGKDKVLWKDRTAIVAIHMTPEKKRLWKELAKAMGSENLQNAFEGFLRTKSDMTGLSDVKKTYLLLRDHQVELGKKLGKEKVVFLVSVYKRLGGDVGKLTNYQEVCNRMLKEWSPKQPKPGQAITDVIQFEAYLEVNKKREEVEKQLLLGYGGGMTAGAAPAPAPTVA